jgi:hypothetical protein
MFRFTEARDSRAMTADPPSFTYRYHAVGSDCTRYINSFALSATPAIVETTWGLLYRADVRITWRGFQVASVEIPYTSRETPVGSYRLDYDTTGSNTHIMFSKESIARFPAGAPDFKQLIGVNEGQVEGTDIIIPALRITAHFKHPVAVMTLPKIKQLARLTGKVNSDEFLTFAPGEVLFMGSVGTEGSDVDTEAAYHFAMSENAEGLSIGAIADIVKKGWESIWVRWQDTIDADTLVKQPVGAYVERVYDTAAFKLALGFG